MSEPTGKTDVDLVQDLLALGCEGIRWTVSLPVGLGVLVYSRRCPFCGVEFDCLGEVCEPTLRLALLMALKIEEESDRDDLAHGNVCLERVGA